MFYVLCIIYLRNLACVSHFLQLLIELYSHFPCNVCHHLSFRGYDRLIMLIFLWKSGWQFFHISIYCGGCCKCFHSRMSFGACEYSQCAITRSFFGMCFIISILLHRHLVLFTIVYLSIRVSVFVYNSPLCIKLNIWPVLHCQRYIWKYSRFTFASHNSSIKDKSNSLAPGSSISSFVQVTKYVF